MMEKVIVYVDDAAYAARLLEISRSGRAAQTTHWLLVACAPRMTHRVSKWVSHSAREAWRGKWADRLFAEVVPPLHACGDAVSTIIAKGPLPDLTRQLQEEHGQQGALRVVDARRPKAPTPPAAGVFGMTMACMLAAAFD